MELNTTKYSLFLEDVAKEAFRELDKENKYKPTLVTDDSDPFMQTALRKFVLACWNHLWYLEHIRMPEIEAEIKGVRLDDEHGTVSGEHEDA